MARTKKKQQLPIPRAGGDHLTDEREAQRLQDLHALEILDTAPEPVFDDLVTLAGRVSGQPIALVSLLDESRQWLKAKVGIEMCSTDRDIAFCDHVIREQSELVVSDMHLDPRFVEHPLVVGEPHVRFYAGFPLVTSTGSIPGTLCVIGTLPYQLSEDQKDSLRTLARQVVVQLELRVQNVTQAREIQLRQAAEAELARSRHEFKLLAEHSSDIVSRLDDNGKILYVSPSVESVLGIPHVVMHGRDPGEYVHPDDAEPFQQAFESARSGRTRTITIRVARLNGGWRWLEVTLSRLPESRFAPQGVLSAARDVTERVRTTEELARSEQRFRSVYQDSPVGIVLSDENSLIVEVNPALCRLLDREESDIIGQARDAFVPEGDPEPDVIEQYRNGSAPGDSIQMERRIFRPDGDIRWVWISVVRIRGPEGQPWTLAHVQDVTQRKLTEQALADSEANLSAIGRVVRRIQSGQDPRETIVRAAHEIGRTASASLLELSPDDERSLVVTNSTGRALTGSRINLDEASVSAQVWHSGEAVFIPEAAEHPLVIPALLAATGGRSMLWQPIVSHGTVTAILAVAWEEPVTDLSSRAAQAVLLLADEAAVALEHDALMQRYAALATTDQLTGLPNRRAWDDQAGLLLALAERTGGPLVVAIADVDRFKSYNDTHGHLEGDVLLREIGTAVRGQLRALDIVARWGGEEFAIALPGCSIQDAFVVLNRVRTAIPREQTVSVGFAQWLPGATIKSLMHNADQALYQAKNSGRNQVVAAGISR